MHHTAAGDCHGDVYIADGFRGGGFHIVRQDDKIREPTGLELAPVVLAAAAQRRIHRIRLEGFKGAYTLFRAEKNAAAAHPVGRPRAWNPGR